MREGRNMPEEAAFRLPKSSYDELVKIVQAYGNAGQEAVNLDDVARVSAMDKTIISRNNAFLVSAGIIEGPEKRHHAEREIARASPAI
jgi:hypothetical protein